MKKFLLSLVALSAIIFTSCEKSDDSADYVLKISPSTASLSEDEYITLTVTGDGAEDMSWTSCYEPVDNDDIMGSCLVFPDGNTYDIPVSGFSVAGVYKFYAESSIGEGDTEEHIKTAYVKVTITE